MTTETPVQLDDSMLDSEHGVIGPVELTFTGRWRRVEDALNGLAHGPVRFRWINDGDQSRLSIGIPVDPETDQTTLFEYRRLLRSAIDQLEGDRDVFVHWLEWTDGRA